MMLSGERCTESYINDFRSAVPFWGQTSQISSSLFPKRDCGSKGVKVVQSTRVSRSKAC